MSLSRSSANELVPLSLRGMKSQSKLFLCVIPQRLNELLNLMHSPESLSDLKKKKMLEDSPLPRALSHLICSLSVDPSIALSPKLSFARHLYVASC